MQPPSFYPPYASAAPPNANANPNPNPNQQQNTPQNNYPGMNSNPYPNAYPGANVPETNMAQANITTGHYGQQSLISTPFSAQPQSQPPPYGMAPSASQPPAAFNHAPPPYGNANLGPNSGPNSGVHPSGGTAPMGRPSYYPSYPPASDMNNYNNAMNNNTNNNMNNNLNSPGGVTNPAAPGMQLHPHQNQQHSMVDPNQQLFNAQSHYIRPAFTKWPTLQRLKQLPLGIHIQPFAQVPIGRPEIPTISLHPSGVVIRCKRCRTYINPFVSWEAHGKRWQCNVCLLSNETPQFYCRPLDDTSKQRLDRFERPELCTGSVEFIAPSDYMIRPPQPPAFLFLIDVSFSSIASGLVDAVCATLVEFFSQDPVGDSDANPKQKRGPLERTMVGIMTYDTSIHFYALKPHSETRNAAAPYIPQVYMVAQLDDLFLPQYEDLFVNAHDCRSAIISTLKAIPDLWKHNLSTENCMGSALKAAHLVMKHVGGKLLLFTSTPPTTGDFVIRREPLKDKGTQGTDRESELLKPANDQYQQFGQILTQSQISVDMFVCPTHMVANQPGAPPGAPDHSLKCYDLASFAPLAQYTSGELRYYPAFSRHEYGNKLKNELFHILTRNTGWEAVMRIRVSKGWKIAQRFGRFFLRGVDLFVLPTIHQDQSFYISIESEEASSQESAYIQVALLYTNSDGERRIRVHTYAFFVSSNIQEIAATLDPQVVVGLAIQHAIELAKSSKIADARAYLQNLCIQFISAFSAVQTSHGGVYGQPIQPNPNPCADQLRKLALYTLGLLKSIIFRPNKDGVNIDSRVYQWHRMSTICLSQAISYCCPKLYNVTNLQSIYPSSVDVSSVDILSISPSCPATSNSMTQDGAFLIENGESLLLWIGKSISPNWLNSVFGVPSLEYLHPESAALSIGKTNDPLGLCLYKLIQELKQQNMKPDCLHLLIIRQGDMNEQLFFSMLIEDRVQWLPLTLDEFLQRVGQRQSIGPMATNTSNMQTMY